MNKILHIYALAYIRRNANILLNYLSPLITYTRPDQLPMIIEKHLFVDYLNNKFVKQEMVSEYFSGCINLVEDSDGLLFLYFNIYSKDFLLKIKTINGLINKIDIETVEQKKFKTVEVIIRCFKNENFDIVNDIKYVGPGYILIEHDTEPNKVMDTIIKTNYKYDYCISYSLEPKFISNLMYAGFIIMTTPKDTNINNDIAVTPAHHISRSVLRFNDLHIGKTIKRFIKRYELKFDTDFELIIKKCYNIHGNDWLTIPLIETILKIKNEKLGKIKPVSFGLYKNGELKAGEFGIISGKIYSSYSGYYEENNAGNVQMILTANYLRNHDFKLWDLGMPLVYKEKLGAKNIDLEEFLMVFRKYRNMKNDL